MSDPTMERLPDDDDRLAGDERIAMAPEDIDDDKEEELILDDDPIFDGS